MNDNKTQQATKILATPIVFGAVESRCFGWFHSPQTQAVGMGVVLCRPAGYEGTCAYETYIQLAEKLAAAGFAVVRFDYHGTGDSVGSDTDPHRVRAWLDSTQSAIQELKRLGGVSRVALFGVRLGATLAAVAATECGGVDRMVMWAPCVTGRAFARELKASRSRLSAADEGDGDGDLESLGYVYTAQTLQDLQTLDCQRLSRPPAGRVLVIGRDDLPIEGPLPAAYRKLGIDTTYTVLPGYASMIVEPHEGVVAHASLATIVDWLREGLGAAASEQAGAATLAPVDFVFDGIRETPLVFGQAQNLFGILAEPAQPVPSADADSHSETAILMLNVGVNHHIGPNRLYVKMARSWAARGYRTLRLDLSGIGDSRCADDVTRGRLYVKGSTADVQAAIDCLVQRGFKKFIVMGLCSGAYVAFQTALVEPRVTGQILMNPRRLEWRVGETLQSSMQVSYKSTHFYKKELLNPDVYRRVLRGQVDVKGIVGRMLVLLKVRLKRAAGNALRAQPAREDVLANAKRISSKGADTLMIIGAEDDGRDYIEFHLGVRGKRMGRDPRFAVEIVTGSDHTFSNAHGQDSVIALIPQYLDRVATA